MSQSTVKSVFFIAAPLGTMIQYQEMEMFPLNIDNISNSRIKTNLSC